MDVQLLLVPYDSGQRGLRMGAGPEHLCAAGLQAHLAARGHTVFLEVVEATLTGWRAEVATSFELIRALATRVRAARALDRFPLVLSGNCNAAVGVVAGLGAGTGVLWFDAHADFNTPETTASGFLDGMALSIVTGRCWREMAKTIEGFQPVPDSAVALLGARDFDEQELAALTDSQIIRLNASEAPARIMPLLQSMAPPVSSFYLHLDLDALDPAEGQANAYAVTGGFTRADLTALLSTIAGKVHVSTLTVSAFEPSCDETDRITETAFATITAVLDARH